MGDPIPLGWPQTLYAPELAVLPPLLQLLVGHYIRILRSCTRLHAIAAPEQLTTRPTTSPLSPVLAPHRSTERCGSILGHPVRPTRRRASFREHF